ncbi:MAG: Trm112 family protein [Methylophilaceae bacterium]|jgi:uncharacterized protein YbaR (Trm112 family)|nr:Trm112 family protein [Methylophilaceae bacterium]NCA27469.1 Trm112 family protein [Methylophilaceae bacterium]
MDAKLLDILVCPICKSRLHYKKLERELICKPCRLAFPIKDDIPVMLEDEARKLADTEEI